TLPPGRCSLSCSGGGLPRVASALRLLPDPPVVHQLDLPLDDFLAVLGVLHGLTLEIEVLRIDRLLVEQLVELSAEVLHPVVPLAARALITQRFHVAPAAHVVGSAAALL